MNMSADTEREEAALLGALLLEPAMLADVVRILDKEAFSDATNAAIFAELVAMFDAGEAIDIFTVARRPNVLSAFKGDKAQARVHIVDLTQQVASGKDVTAHAMIIAQEAVRRRIARFAANLTAYVADSSRDVGHIIGYACNQIDSITQSAVTGGNMISLGDAIRQEMANVEERSRNFQAGTPSGIATGLNALDNITGGWQRGQLIVLGGRPAMGKTAILQHFVLAAARQGTPVCWFSLEMSASELAGRIMAGQSGVSKGRIKVGDLTSDDWKRLEVSAGNTSTLPILINDAANLTMRDIRSQVIPLSKQGRCGMVVIDYLQLLQPSGRNTSREQEVAGISRAAKLLAKELSVPVVLLAQLSRQVEARADKTPILSDLRESGAIEQDADMVLFVDRPEMRGEQFVADGIPAENAGRLIVAKHRNGQTGIILFRHNGAMTRVEDYPEI